MAKEVKSLAAKAGVGDRTLRRAKALLRVKSKRRGFGPGSRFYWKLPEKNALLEHLVNQDLEELAKELKEDSSGPSNEPQESLALRTSVLGMWETLSQIPLEAIVNEPDLFESAETRTIAYHEAGHAYIALLQGREVSHVRLLPDDPQSGGHTCVLLDGLAKILHEIEASALKHEPVELLEKAFGEPIDREIEMLLAGYATESILGGGTSAERVRSAMHDLQMAIKQAALCDRDKVAMVRRICRGVQNAIETLKQPANWQRVQAIANCLVREQEIGSERLKQLASRPDQRIAPRKVQSLRPVGSFMTDGRMRHTNDAGETE